MRDNEMRREETRRVEGERRPDQIQEGSRGLKFWELVDKKLLLQMGVFARCGNFGANQHKVVNTASFGI